MFYRTAIRIIVITNNIRKTIKATELKRVNRTLFVRCCTR